MKTNCPCDVVDDCLMYCPDCDEQLVKAYIECSDGSGWYCGWLCGCKKEENNE